MYVFERIALLFFFSGTKSLKPVPSWQCCWQWQSQSPYSNPIYAAGGKKVFVLKRIMGKVNGKMGIKGVSNGDVSRICLVFPFVFLLDFFFILLILMEPVLEYCAILDCFMLFWCLGINSKSRLSEIPIWLIVVVDGVA